MRQKVDGFFTSLFCCVLYFPHTFYQHHQRVASQESVKKPETNTQPATEKTKESYTFKKQLKTNVSSTFGKYQNGEADTVHKDILIKFGYT